MTFTMQIKTDAEETAEEEKNDAEPDGGQLTTAELPPSASIAVQTTAAAMLFPLRCNRRWRNKSGGIKIVA